MRRLLAVAVAVLSLGCTAARAQTLLNLAAQGSSEAEPDLADAVLNAQASAAEAPVAQDDVNHAMAAALAAAKAVPGLTATTGAYSVFQTTPDNAQKPLYQASQTLRLSMAAPGGAPPGAFVTLVGQLQKKGLLLNSLDGDLSGAARQAAQLSAVNDGIRQIEAEAQAIAATLHEHVGKITTLNVNINMSGPSPRAPMLMMAAAPQLAPAKVTVQAEISASITLTPPP